MHRRFGGHNRPSLSGPSIPCPRVETRDRHEAPLPVKTETGVLKKKGRQNNRYIGVLHRAARNTPRTEYPDKAKWFCSMSGHKRSLRAGPGSGGIYIFGRHRLCLGIFSKCPYKIQWHMKMPQYNHFICHFYCHFSVFSHILL